MVNLGILKITFNCFLTYRAIQTRPPVLLVDSPYKSCIVPAEITEPPPKLAVVKTTSTMVDRLVEYFS